MRPTLIICIGMGSWAAMIAAIACGARFSGLSPDWEHAFDGALMLGTVLCWVPLLITERLGRRR